MCFTKSRQLRLLLKSTRSLVGGTCSKAFSPKYLLFTNMALSASLSAGADSVVQLICKRYSASNKTPKSSIGETIDKGRVLRVSFTGMCAGIVGHYWYIFLDKKMVGNSLQIVLKKTLVDQIVFAPVGIALFFILLGYLENSSRQDIVNEIKKKGPEVMLVDWLVYPPAQFINFRFLPTRFRILFDCGIAFMIDIYYSHMKYER